LICIIISKAFMYLKVRLFIKFLGDVTKIPG
jgi:hypothetical protein